MKNFLFRLFLFSIPVIIFLIGCEIFVRTMPSVYKNKRDQLIASADSIEILIMGSSHAMDGVDPNQFSLYAFNLAFGSQSIYFDRKLIEKYRPVLPRLKYVLLNIDYNSLSYDHEEKRDFFYKYHFDLTYKNRKFFKENLLQSFFVYNHGNIIQLIFSKKSKSAGLVKGWFNNAGTNNEMVMSEERSKLRANSFNYTVNTWKGGDSVIIELEELIRFLLSENITPILITYPNFSSIRYFLDESVINRNRNVAESLSQKYQIPYLDYFDDDSFTVSDFFNSDHLNAAGAAKLSKMINTVIMNMENDKN